MDLGVKLLYLSFFDKSNQSNGIGSIYHELTKVSPVFYYLERKGLGFKRFK